MKTKKYLKIASLVVVAAIFIWTFVFLYQKSQPKVKVYETIVPEIADLEKTTVATGKWSQEMKYSLSRKSPASFPKCIKKPDKASGRAK